MTNQAPTHIVAFKMVDAPEAGRGYIAYECLCGYTTSATLPGTNASLNAQSEAKRAHWDAAYGSKDIRLGRSADAHCTCSEYRGEHGAFCAQRGV